MKKIDYVQTLDEKELPANWSFSTIADLIGSEGLFSDGDWVESKDQDPEGDVRLIQLADIGEYKFRDKSSRFLTSKKAIELRCSYLEKNDILIARMPDPLGRACLFPGDEKRSITVVDVAIVRCSDDDFNHKWLMYFINAPATRAAIESLQSGSTRKRISRKNIARILLPVPPRNMQDEIVAEIEKQFSRLDEAVTSLKRAKAKLKRYKAAVLKAAVEGKLTEEWRKQYPDVESASELLKRILAERRRKWEESDIGELFPIPEKWAWARLKDVFDVITDGDHQAPPKSETGIPFLVIGNVSKGNIDFSSTRFVAKQYYDSLVDYRKPQLGDLLYTVVGSYGIPIKVDTEIPFCVQRHISILKTNEYVLRDYLYYLLSSSFVYEQSTKVATGTAQKTVPLGGLRNIQIPIPPYDEQVEIVTALDVSFSSVTSIEKTIEANQIRGNRIKQAILSQAYKGIIAEKA